MTTDLKLTKETAIIQRRMTWMIFLAASLFSGSTAEASTMPKRLQVGRRADGLRPDHRRQPRSHRGMGSPRPPRAACGSWSSRKARCAATTATSRRAWTRRWPPSGQAAREHRVYVLCGGASYPPKAKRDVNWMFVVGPDGREVFRYDKLYDKHDAKMPGVFHIDGIPCSAMICADRWLRGVEEIPIQQGAQVSFELSCNFASEWVAPFEWYWYVPRALRNNVWVVFANSGNKVSGVSDSRRSPRPAPRPLRDHRPGRPDRGGGARRRGNPRGGRTGRQPGDACARPWPAQRIRRCGRSGTRA